MHHAEDIVGGAVHDAADLIDGADALEPLQIGQPRDTAADRGGGAEAHAGLPREGGQLIITGGKKLLIGGDDIFAGAHGSGDVIERRLQTAHDLHDGIHLAVLQNDGKIGDGNGAQLRDGDFIQYIFNGDIGAVF